MGTLARAICREPSVSHLGRMGQFGISEVLIAGGGPAGAAAACALAAAGREVVLVERTGGPTHKICGEFMSAETEAMLARLGVDLAGLGATRISHLRLVRGGRSVAVRLPRPAFGLTRRALDEALLARAAALGATLCRGERVRRVLPDRSVQTDQAVRQGGALLLATGKHEVRGAVRAAAAPDLVGFKMHFALAPAARAALEGAVELLLFPDAYAGLQAVEGGRATLCLLADRARLARAGGDWPGLLGDLCAASPVLAGRLAGATPLFDRALTIARVPYGFVHRARAEDPEGIYRVGDQLGVIPSFCGDGIAIALHSAAAAADAVLRGESAGSYHRRLGGRLRPRIGLAGALYAVGRTGAGQAAVLGLARGMPGLVRGAIAATRVA